MDPLLKLLSENGRLNDREIAERLNLTESEARARREAYENNGTIQGYQAIINDDVRQNGQVLAFIEVKIRPERGGGFDRLANRISRFPEVTSCFLASGGFDLLVAVEAADMHAIAVFVAEKLAAQEGVLSTATHFHLKTYKKNGFIMELPQQDERLAVSP